MIQIGALFLPGGQFISAAIGFGIQAAEMGKDLAAWTASKATVDPAKALVDQQQAESALLADTIMMAIQAVDLAISVTSGFEALEAGRTPKGDVPDKPGAAKVNEIEQNLSKRRPSEFPGCDEEIPLDDGHFWRRSSDTGVWCRFSDSPQSCIVGLEGEALEERLGIRLRDLTARNTLKNKLPPPPGPGKWKAHHVIPVEYYNNRVVRHMRETLGWDFNSAENGFWLPEDATNPAAANLPIHGGEHTAYNNSIGARLNQIEGKFNAGEISEQHLSADFHALIDEYKDRLRLGKDFKRGVQLP